MLDVTILLIIASVLRRANSINTSKRKETEVVSHQDENGRLKEIRICQMVERQALIRPRIDWNLLPYLGVQLQRKVTVRSEMIL